MTAVITETQLAPAPPEAPPEAAPVVPPAPEKRRGRSRGTRPRDFNGLRRINLLPPEVGVARTKQRARLLLVLGLVGLAGVMALLYLMKNSQVAAAKAGLKVQEEKNDALARQVQAEDLQTVLAKKTELDGRIQALAAALGGEVSMVRLLNEISLVIPGNVWLTSMQLQTSPAAAALGAGGQPGAAGASPTAGPAQPAARPQPNATGGAPSPGGAPTGGQSAGGTLSVEAGGLDHPDGAAWLERMASVKSVTSLWIPNMQRNKDQAGGGYVTFTSTAQLTEAARSERSRLLEKGQLP